MDFKIPPRVEGLRQDIGTFLEERAGDVERAVITHGMANCLPELAELRGEVKARGWWCPQLPESHGGMGLSLSEFALVSEVIGRSLVGHYAFNCQAPDAGNMEILIEFGNERQQREFLAPVARGDARSCFSMTERDRPGSNPVWMETRAERDGDEFVINGQKWFTTAADGASFAIVMAITDPEAPPHRRASQIIVPCDTPGFRIVRNVPVVGHVGGDHDSHAEVAYEDCRVPVANLLGEQGAGFAIAQSRLGPGRIHHCMRWLGICARSFELLCRRAAERELAPGDPLGTRQIVQAWIAECRARIEAARWMVLHAAWKIEHEGAKAARVEVSMIKYFVADVLSEVIDRAIQVHGAAGLTDATPLASFYQGERAARIYDGPDEVHKMVVARQVLRQYGVDTRR
ncbi:MAG: acyl-CoA dehydrogenase family protein [Pirellulales bacterium]